MGIYVKGMKMPKEGTCNFCPLAHYHSADDVWICHGCFVYIDGDEVFAPIDEVTDGALIRLPQCPLVELPEKHGRLVDGDWLYKRLYQIDCHDSNVYRLVKDAPTVIEEEGE